jgi:NADH dehydrogenase
MGMRVVILGGGFAGVAAKVYYPKAILIDRWDYFLMTPKLSDFIARGDRAAFPRRPDLRASVLNVDFRGKRVITDKGEVSYDRLVIALGYRQDLSRIKGAEEHVMKLESLEDAMKVREEVGRARRMIVIGGGDLGVEVVGSTVELLSRVRGKERITLINRGPRVLPHMPPEISLMAEDALRKLGVEIVDNAEVEEIRGKVVETNRGEFAGDHIFFAGGIGGPSILKSMGLTTKDSKMVVNEDLSSVDHSDVYGAGACTSLSFPSNAQVSMQSGVHAVRNTITGNGEKFRPKSLADVVEVSGQFVGVFMGSTVTGGAASLLKAVALTNVFYKVKTVNFLSEPL